MSHLQLIPMVAGLESPGDDLPVRLHALSEALTASRDDAEHARLLDRAVDLLGEAERRLAVQHRQIAHLERLSRTDGLTGLLNRRGFEDRLHGAIADWRAAGAGVTSAPVLLMLDMDGLKPVNDNLGHLAGDAMLSELARVLRLGYSDEDAVGRLGGDEFAVLIATPHLADPGTYAKALATRLGAVWMAWQGGYLPLRASIGGTHLRFDDTTETALRRADAALYEHKLARRRVA